MRDIHRDTMANSWLARHLLIGKTQLIKIMCLRRFDGTSPHGSSDSVAKFLQKKVPFCNSFTRWKEGLKSSMESRNTYAKTSVRPKDKEEERHRTCFLDVVRRCMHHL